MTRAARRDEDAHRRAVRKRRYQLRDELFTASALPRVQWCGRRRVGPQVTILKGARGAGYGGVAYCSSMWACPVCSAMIRQRRADELERGVTPFLEAGGGGLLLTLTIPHDFDDDLDTTFRIVREGWAKVRRNSAAQRAWERAGVVGYIKAVEITHGRNGFHPHLHVLVLTEAPLSEDQLADFAGAVEAAWVVGATPPGRRAPSAEFGVHAQSLHVRGRLDRGRLVQYLAKVQDGHGFERSVGLEVTRGDLKTGRKKSCTPFELLAQLREARRSGSVRRQRRLAALWGEYEAVTRGRHGILWSRGLKARLGVDEKPDEQLVEESVNEGAVAFMHLDAFAWMAVCRAGARSQVLDLAETAGELAVWRCVARLLDEERRQLMEAWRDDPPDLRVLDDCG